MEVVGHRRLLKARHHAAGQDETLPADRATGQAVIVIHEVYGFTPTLARFGRWVRDAGFRVYAPILFGSPDAGNTEKPTLRRILSLCVSREFTLLAANKSSPVDWLRALGRLAHQECGGRGVGG